MQFIPKPVYIHLFADFFHINRITTVTIINAAETHNSCGTALTVFIFYSGDCPSLIINMKKTGISGLLKTAGYSEFYF